jgi:hypothetical protein
MQEQQVSDESLRQQALVELNHRVEDWWAGPGCALSKFLDYVPPRLPVVVSGDPRELLIARAISTSPDPATFGVTAQGEVFVPDNGRWDGSGRAVFVTGLSPMLDEVTNICSRLTDGTGGRFREREGRFSLDPAVHSDVSTFAVVGQHDQDPGGPGIWDRLVSIVLGWWQGDKSSSSGDDDHTSPRGESHNAAPTGDTSATREAVYELVVNFDTGAWPAAGVLSEMGYRVGNTRGLAPNARRAILRDVLNVQLVATSPETEHYLREWGPPGSATRLRKTKRCLGGFIAGAERKKHANMSAAIADWESDLEWLNTTFGR